MLLQSLYVPKTLKAHSLQGKVGSNISYHHSSVNLCQSLLEGFMKSNEAAKLKGILSNAHHCQCYGYLPILFILWRITWI